MLQPVVQEHLKKPCPNPIEEDLAASRTESEPSGKKNGDEKMDD